MKRKPSCPNASSTASCDRQRVHADRVEVALVDRAANLELGAQAQLHAGELHAADDVERATRHGIGIWNGSDRFWCGWTMIRCPTENWWNSMLVLYSLSPLSISTRVSNAERDVVDLGRVRRHRRSGPRRTGPRRA